MNNRATKIIRWILLFPLTFAVPMLAWELITGVHNGGFYHARSLWYSMLGLAPNAAAWFIPAFLAIPTACVVAPSRRKKVSIIILIALAFFWLMFWGTMFSPPTEITTGADESFQRVNIFRIVESTAQALGLLAGFALVRFALNKHEKGEPFLKRSAIAFIAVICIAAIPICFFEKGDAGVGIGDFAWQEQSGVVSYSFTVENMGKKKTAIAVEVTAVRGHSRNPAGSIYTEEILAAAKSSTEKTRIEIVLAPKEVKKHTGQLTLDAPADDTLILIPLLTQPNSP